MLRKSQPLVYNSVFMNVKVVATWQYQAQCLTVMVLFGMTVN
jgi:hypothetical protein